jgi:hypothetical protein
MPSDFDFARLCNGIYAYAGDVPVQWDHYSIEEVFWAYKRLGADDVIIFRGSVTFADWLDDFDFVSNPFAHSELGDVHRGFLVGMPDAWTRIKAVLRPGAPLHVAGHSLGAARATVCAALAINDGIIPQSRVVFGEPQPGFQSFAQKLAPIPHQASYCNGDKDGHDLITEVPFSLPAWPYVHPTPLTQVSATPDPAIREKWRAFAYHHCPLYVRALAPT